MSTDRAAVSVRLRASCLNFCISTRRAVNNLGAALGRLLLICFGGLAIALIVQVGIDMFH